MIGCTVVARNYLAHARTLARSFAEHHPGAPFVVLVLDGPPDAPVESAEILALDEIGIDRAELHRMAAIYSVLELSTAVKPWLLRTLLARGQEVVYLDADILVLADLEEVAELARRHAIVLTPHLTEPLPLDGRTVGEEHIRSAGAFNLGFLGLSPEAAPFLDWWQERLARDCVVDVAHGMFVDQRYVDLVPGLFGAHVVRDPTLNVAYWNAHSRPLEQDGGRYLVGGRPLRFFHFSGFDPREPWLLSRHQGERPRVLLSEHPALAGLCREYADRLLEEGFAECVDVPYGFGRTSTGMPLDARARQLYRSALETSEPPDPFAAETGQQFVDWLNEPVVPSGVSRYLMALRSEQANLGFVFPDVAGRDGEAYLAWVASDGRTDEAVPLELVPTLPAGPVPGGAPAAAAEGVNVVGYLTAELGLGEAARQVVGALEQAEIPFSAVVHRGATLNRQEHDFRDDGLAAARFDTNLVCINADAIIGFRATAGPALFDGRYTIGCWWWEVDVFPAQMRPALALVDEVWAGSSFVARNLAAATDKPVVTIPLSVDVPQRSARTREDLGVPDGFVFLFALDVASVFERKNPLAIVDAFSRAFAPDEGPALLIKTINGHRFPAQLERLRHATAHRADVHVVDGYLDPADKNALIGLCDCYVSLHRSEGFGLTLAEAMALGKPTIATRYGGNLDFMDDDNSFLVDWRQIPVGPACYPYPPEAVWAEPDVEHAARLMRGVVEDVEGARRRGEAGRASLLASHSRERAATAIAARLAEIRALRGDAPQPAPLTSSSVARSAAWLEHGPTTPWDAPSRLGPLGRGLRRALRRVLHPYELRQREFDRIVVDALMELNHVGHHVQEELAVLGRRSRGASETARAFLAVERARLDALRQETSRAAVRLEGEIDELRGER